jgi:predicted GNAT superfamily acetyltransferase
VNADDADVSITLVSELDELRALAAFFDALWQRTTPALPPELFRALTHAGNYAASATHQGRLVGGLAGFLGWHGEELVLHSHILGVAPDIQHRGVGAALKLHQRWWAREHGLGLILWTFDPLVRRNARFNLRRLGVMTIAYLPDFYGPMHDSFNADAPTDRLLVAWPTTPDLAPGREPPGSAETVLDCDVRGLPVTRPLGASRVRCVTPPDIVTLRRQDPQSALAWNLALRETLGGALSEGYEVEGLDDEGAYVLSR